MTSKQIQERITKAQEKITRKENTIYKKTNQVEKKRNALAKKYGINAETFDKYNVAEREKFGKEESYDIYWTLCDIDGLLDDIKRGGKEIEEIKNTIKKYEKQLQGELEKESLFAKQIPDSMIKLQDKVVAEWDSWDLSRKKFLQKKYDELGYRAFMDEYKYSSYCFMHTPNEEIHKENVKAAKGLVLNLFNRIKEITGEVTDWSGIQCECGNQGMPVLTGFVKGKEGRARVETILAGGYNIQRLHIRTIVTEVH